MGDSVTESGANGSVDVRQDKNKKQSNYLNSPHISLIDEST